MEKKILLQLRIDPELHARLKAAAAADGRSIANYIRRLISEATKGTNNARP